MIDLKTTTRPRRHVQEFRDMVRLLPPATAGKPLAVAEIGPGLAIKYFGRLSATDVPLSDIFRRIEAGLRRVPMPDAFFENYETRELIAALSGIPFDLTLIDINPKVVRVVRKNFPGRQVRSTLVNLGIRRPPELQPLVGTFDLVTAFAVIARVSPRFTDNAHDNIRSLVKPGGLLIGGGEFAADDCEPVAGVRGFYRKLAAPVAVAGS